MGGQREQLANANLDDVLDLLKEQLNEVQTFYANLSVEQLNWRVSAERWSIAQVLDHLTMTNLQYISCIKKRLDGSSSPFMGRFAALNNLWAKVLYKAVDPENPGRVKAPKIFQPTKPQYDESVVSQFIEQQVELSELIESVSDQEQEQLVIPSPLTGLVTFFVQDAFRILTLHEIRHLTKAKETYDAESFPSS